jgi:hypothetical protein
MSSLLAVREQNNPAQTAQLKILLEGNLIYEGEITEQNTGELETISIEQCCTTHKKDYRYTLLGLGIFEEELDDCTDDTITLTDGTTAVLIDTHSQYTNPEMTESSITKTYQTTDGIMISETIQLKGGSASVDFNYVALAKKKITDTRKRFLYCNGQKIAEDIRYDGIYCCGDFLLCTYIEDDYLSGWTRADSYITDVSANGEDGGETVMTVSRKWTAHSGWGERTPPKAADRQQWQRYKTLYPGFAVDVFYKGEKIATQKISDFNSPIYYDHLGTSQQWLWLAMYYSGIAYTIGTFPLALEGSPECSEHKLLILFDGGLTTCVGDQLQRQSFP